MKTFSIILLLAVTVGAYEMRQYSNADCSGTPGMTVKPGTCQNSAFWPLA